MQSPLTSDATETEIEAGALALLSDWQDDFPLVDEPFEAMGERLGLPGEAVIARLRSYEQAGHVSRIGAVWESGAGGAAALCALALPPQRLQAVAHAVSACPQVSHNYEREHAWNLWFVLTGSEVAFVRRKAAAIAREHGVPSLFLPMLRCYRVNLGFDLRAPHAPARERGAVRMGTVPVAPYERRLAAVAERGLPLVRRPYDHWADELGWPRAAVLQTLRRWKNAGTLRRFGVVVRHHEFGFDANAMTVIQSPPDRADELGAALAMQAGVTLAYRRATDPRWPYDLYFMVHGRERAAAQALVARALAATGADALPHATLFSRRRFKQTGGRYFADAAQEDA